LKGENMSDKVQVTTVMDEVSNTVEFRIRIPRNQKLLEVFDVELQQMMKDALATNDNRSFVYGINELVNRMER